MINVETRIVNARWTTRVSVALVGVLILSNCSGPEDAEWRDGAAEHIGVVGADNNYEFDVVGNIGVVVESDAESTVHAIDPSTGEHLWELDGKYESNVWATSDKLVAQTVDKEAEVRSLSTGEETFTIPLQGDGSESGMVSAVTENTLVIQGSHGQTDELVAFDLNTGDKTWTWQDGDGDVADNGEHAGSGEVWANTPSTAPSIGYAQDLDSRSRTLRVALDTNIVFVGEAFDTGDRNISAVDADTGEELWKQDAPQSGWVSIMEYVGNDLLVMKPGYLSNDSTACLRRMVTVDTSTENTVEVETPRFNYNADTKDWTCGDGSDFTPVSSEGILAQDAEHRTQLFDISTGEPTWTAEDAGEPLALENDTAVYRTWNKEGTETMHVVDTEHNKDLWTKQISGDLNQVLVFDDKILQTTDNGTWVNELKTGKRLWRYPGGTPVHLTDDAYYFRSVDDEAKLTRTRPDGQ